MPRLPNLPDVEITLRRSARARRFSLRVSSAEGRVTLTLPTRAREAEALSFARAQEDWLRAALARVPVQALVGIGAEMPFEGVLRRIESGPGRAVQLVDDRLLVPGDPAQAGARLAAWAKARARDRLVAAADRHAAQLGRPVAAVALRDTRSRWGSCAASGRLMFNWRLILAPPAVLDYVAAHEVAHLVEMNHSPAFWAVVARLCPGWQAERAWLRAHGAGLQALRFGAA